MTCEEPRNPPSLARAAASSHQHIIERDQANAGGDADCHGGSAAEQIDSVFFSRTTPPAGKNQILVWNHGSEVLAAASNRFPPRHIVSDLEEPWPGRLKSLPSRPHLGQELEEKYMVDGTNMPLGKKNTTSYRITIHLLNE